MGAMGSVLPISVLGNPSSTESTEACVADILVWLWGILFGPFSSKTALEKHLCKPYSKKPFAGEKL